MNTTSSDCLIKIKFYDKKKYVKVDQRSVCDWRNFVRGALIEFGFDPDSIGSVLMWDNNDIQIQEEFFPVLVKQYMNCSNFFLKLAIKSDPNEPLLVQELKYYLLENGCRCLFLEWEHLTNEDAHENANQNIENENQVDEAANFFTGNKVKRLCDESVQLLKAKIMDYIDSNYSTYRWDEIELVCKATVALFPCIKIEELCDLKKRRGAIINRVHYNKYKKPSRKQKRTREFLGAIENFSDEEQNNNNDLDELNWDLFFRTCLYGTEADLAVLKLKLSHSIEIREALIKKKNTVFHKSFPFYFVQPFLISYDFEIRNNSIDSNALFTKWPKLKNNILTAVKPTERDQCLKWFNDDIGYFLALLKIVSPNSAKLEEVIGKFIIHSDKLSEEPKGCMDSTNKYPHIIAIGEVKTDIKRFYITLEKQLILVPTDFSFEGVVDLFFKLHHIFNMKYHPNLKNMLIFIEHYVYEMDESNVPVNVTKISQKVFND